MGVRILEYSAVRMKKEPPKLFVGKMPVSLASKHLQFGQVKSEILQGWLKSSSLTNLVMRMR